MCKDVAQLSPSNGFTTKERRQPEGIGRLNQECHVIATQHVGTWASQVDPWRKYIAVYCEAVHGGPKGIGAAAPKAASITCTECSHAPLCRILEKKARNLVQAVDGPAADKRGFERWAIGILAGCRREVCSRSGRIQYCRIGQEKCTGKLRANQHRTFGPPPRHR